MKALLGQAFGNQLSSVSFLRAESVCCGSCVGLLMRTSRSESAALNNAPKFEDNSVRHLAF